MTHVFLLIILKEINMLPLSPKQVKAEKLEAIPDFVIEAVNDLIRQNYSDYGFTLLYQKDIVQLIIDRHNVSEDEIYKNKWLDFEDLYRKAGWAVVYDKPAYCESYPATFKFTPIPR